MICKYLEYLSLNFVLIKVGLVYLLKYGIVGTMSDKWQKWQLQTENVNNVIK